MKEKRIRITDTAALLVLAVFALCILLVLLTGANLYRNLVNRGEDTYLRRTALQYLSTRVRQAQSVEIGDFSGCDALILEEELEGEVCTTRIYCYDGWLRELYTVPGGTFSPQEGNGLLEAADLTLTRDGNLLTLTLEEDVLYLWLPEGTEVGS